MKISDTVPQGQSHASVVGQTVTQVKVVLCIQDAHITRSPRKYCIIQSKWHLSPLLHLCGILQYVYVVIEQ